MEFVTVINRKKCKKIYKAIRKPIILFLETVSSFV